MAEPRMLAEERIPHLFHLSFKRVPVEEPSIAGRRAASAAAPRKDDDRKQQGRRTEAHFADHNPRSKTEAQRENRTSIEWPAFVDLEESGFVFPWRERRIVGD